MIRMMIVVFLFFKQKTADELRIIDWSSDVCSSDLKGAAANVSNAATAVDPLLSPEKGLAVELGMKQRFWDGRLSFDIALYHQEIGRASCRASVCKYV